MTDGQKEMADELSPGGGPILFLYLPNDSFSRLDRTDSTNFLRSVETSAPDFETT